MTATSYACPKQRWRSEKAAVRVLLDIWRKFPDDPKRRELRAYRCDRCRRWHLTSQSREQA